MVEVNKFMGADFKFQRALPLLSQNIVRKSPPVPPATPDAKFDWRIALAVCRAVDNELSRSDAGFIERLVKQGRKPGPRQIVRLRNIHAWVAREVLTSCESQHQ